MVYKLVTELHFGWTYCCGAESMIQPNLILKLIYLRELNDNSKNCICDLWPIHSTKIITIIKVKNNLNYT